MNTNLVCFDSHLKKFVEFEYVDKCEDGSFIVRDMNTGLFGIIYNGSIVVPCVCNHISYPDPDNFMDRTVTIGRNSFVLNKRIKPKFIRGKRLLDSAILGHNTSENDTSSKGE